MRLKEADSPLDVPASQLNIHNVSQRDRNRNQSTGDKLPPGSPVIHSTQWANNYVTSPNTTRKEVHHLSNDGSNFNNNITASLQQHLHRSSFSASSDILSESSPDDSLGDFEEAQQSCSSSSLDVSPQGDEYRCFSHDDLSDSDSLSSDGNCQQPPPPVSGRGIVNPNYPGFQHLAHQLHPSDTDEEDEEIDNNIYNNNNNNNNNNNGDDDDAEILDDTGESKIDSVNHLDSVENFQKAFYDKPKFNIPVDSLDDCLCCGSVVDSDPEKHLNVQFPDTNIVDVGDTKEHEVNIVGDPETKQEDESSNVSASVESDSGVSVTNMATITLTNNISANAMGSPALSETKKIEIDSGKMEDAFLPAVVKEEPPLREEYEVMKRLGSDDASVDSNRASEKCDSGTEKFCKEEQTSKEKEKDDDSVIPRKKEKMEMNYSYMSSIQDLNPGGGGVVRRREAGTRSGRDLANRRSLPAVREKSQSSAEILGGFDVYNIETAMPKIDLDAIEAHLKAAKEEERRRRNDREEIRRRLAMGSDADEYYGGERPGRKPSLQARLQSGMNLQICFMNETVSDTESPNSDTETISSPSKSISPLSQSYSASSTKASTPPPQIVTPSLVPPVTRPSPSSLTLPLRREQPLDQPMTEADFFARQARLQAEARLALAQAKEMAHMQMEVERQRQKKSPITEMVRSSLEKVGIPFPDDRRRVSRQILTEMNLAQLQVIVNDLHTQIEVLNENLVKFLMDRDDLHMEQDSMLVDIEDLTRYLGRDKLTIEGRGTGREKQGAKEQSVKEQQDVHSIGQNNNNHLIASSKPKINRIASLVKK